MRIDFIRVTFKRNTEFNVYTLFKFLASYFTIAKRVSFVNVNVIEHRLDLQRVVYRDEDYICDYICTLIGDETTVSFEERCWKQRDILYRFNKLSFI